MKISVVVAAYDEEANVGALVDRLAATLRGMGCGFELVFVVEGTDATRRVLEARREAVPELLVLDGGPEPTGLGAAFRRGFLAVSKDADLVVTLDADLNHQPEEIPRLVAALVDRDVDVVIGSRWVRGARSEGTPAWKRALSYLVNGGMRRIFRTPIGDKTSGFRVYRAETLRGLAFASDGFAFLPELLLAAEAQGRRLREEPIHFVFRRAGTSKLRFWATSAGYLGLFRKRFFSRD